MYNNQYENNNLNQYQNNMYGVGEQNQNPPYGYNQKPPKKRKKKGRIITIILVILLLVFGGFFAIGMIIQNNDKKESSEVLDTFIEGYNNQNFDEAYDTFHPYIRQQIKQNVLDANYVTDGEEFFELYDSYFGGLHVEYEINESEKLSKNDIQSLVSQIYSAHGVRMELDKAYAYEITETYSGSNGTMVQIETVIIGKDNDNWYIVAASTNEVVSNTLDSGESQSVTDTNDANVNIDPNINADTNDGSITNDNDLPDTGVVTDNTNQDNVDITDEDIYESYADVVQNYLDYYNASTDEEGYTVSVNEYEDVSYDFSLYKAGRDVSQPAFMIYDLNSDGVEELILILRSDTDSTRYVIHDIRTYVNGSVIQLIQYSPGMSLELCENGAITETWSLGGDFGESYYVLPDGGSDLEQIYYIVCSYNADIDETYISNNIDAYTSERLTEEEYQSILDYYKEITIDSYELNAENISLLRDGRLTENWGTIERQAIYRRCLL